MFELYHAENSTCSQKVRLCLFEKDIAWISHPVALELGEHLTSDYLRLNPNGVVPTLVHNGSPIVESSVIIEYVDEVSDTCPLMPADALGRARARSWIHYLDEVPTAAIRLPTIQAAYKELFTGEGATLLRKVQRESPLRKGLWQKFGSAGFADSDLLTALSSLRQTVRRIDAAVAATGGGIASGQHSLADLVAMPLVDRLNDLGLCDLWSDLPHMSAWWRTVTSRPAYQAAIPATARLSAKQPDLAARSRAMAQAVLARSGLAALTQLG